MREILFRGKTEKGKWIYGGYAKCNNREYILPDIDLVGYEWVFKNIEVIPKTVGQFTGLTDKNGKKIFEGDIVAYNTLYIDGKEYQEIGYFECCENFVSFIIHGKNITPFYCEVIGNKWDNPELLEKTNENQTK